MRKHYLFFLLVSPLILIGQSNGDIDRFLATNAVKVDSTVVIENINRFLNYEVEKGKVVWFQGSLRSKKEQFNNLELNFNVLDNSLYLLRKGQVYRISNLSLVAFKIHQKGELFNFMKGFATYSFRSRLKVEFTGSPQEMIQYFSSYSEYESLQIRDFRVFQNHKTILNIALRTAFKKDVFDLKNFFDSNPSVVSSEVDYKPSELGESKYFQVLFEHEMFSVLKYHFKRSATSESVSLVKHEASFMFSDEDYYIADANNELQEFLFTKKSIERVLSSLEIKYSKKLKSLGNETKVIKWFQSNTFY